MRKVFQTLIALMLLFSASAASNLVDTVRLIKPSVVGIGVYTPIGQPKNKLYGSGFVIGDGSYVVTNHHVIARELDDNLLQKLAVFVGKGQTAKVKFATVVASDKATDIAVLKIESEPLPALTLAQQDFLPDGSEIAFTGFPIGAVLGLYPATHRGIIAGLTPTITPLDDTRQISIAMLRQLRDPFLVYQLDATAYPGNSGSAMYDVNTGAVVGIINKVFVQQSKETVISKPSGISYAIPVKYLHQLLKKHNIKA
ncbi:Trypsin-like peptidase domain-containing protein [Colwellia chukchiensis]|uniref:Trypsin-like peptidase domain-containing protein n=1 Tax=Colwellia chukchiensis TaxID=641665 RepID=A0A1H7T6X4_9GAMM|nr:serine protease [Colwellia chukchiensis]SEL80265.1 Trypsin-like peptidase domain-containing protein [Colwellia chukchiensis]